MKRSPLKRKVGVGKSLSSKRKVSPQGKNKPSKPKSVSLSKLKKELDRVFSLYIRAKYPKVCYTCHKINVTLQCGHFVSRTYLATRWDENNCRPQCVGCNIWGRGQLLDFEEHLIQELGFEQVRDIKSKRHEVLKLNRAYYLENIAKYKALLEE